MLPTEPIGGAEIHRHAVLYDAILLKNLIEYLQRTTAIDHEVLRNNLEPVDNRFFLEDMAVMRHPEADADAVVAEVVKSIGRHAEGCLASGRRIGGSDSGSLRPRNCGA